MKENISAESKTGIPEREIWALVLLLQPTLSRPLYAGAKKKE